jgi:hypothetical protein
MRFALKDITMSANKRVVAVQKPSEPSENTECRIFGLTEGDHTSG